MNKAAGTPRSPTSKPAALGTSTPPLPRTHLRRLEDLLLQMRFLEVQLAVIEQSKGPHLLRNVGLRVAALHERLNELEHELRRRARHIPDARESTSRDLRRRLEELTQHDPHYRGPERRLQRRSSRP